jgi:hypothetical protein
VPPSTWAATWSGATATPQSMAVTTRPTRGSPSTSLTSATWATTEPKLSCTATPRVKPRGGRRAGLFDRQVQGRQVPRGGPALA